MSTSGRRLLVIGVSLLCVYAGWSFARSGPDQAADEADIEAPAPMPEIPPGAEVATFAGGCFWCMESVFDDLPGVYSATSGFSGGKEEHPTYEAVSRGGTGHAEAVQVVFDPTVISYSELLQYFWHNIDPTVEDRQFCDVGSQYRSAIFYHNEAQKEAARRSRLELEKDRPFKGEIVTPIVPFTHFYPAEVYHQDYHKKNPLRYKAYRMGCGRDARLRALWGDAAGRGDVRK